MQHVAAKSFDEKNINQKPHKLNQMTQLTHEELFTQVASLSKRLFEFFNKRIVGATKNLQQVNPKMIILLDWQAFGALPTIIIKYKYETRAEEDTLLNNSIKFLTESARLSKLAEIAKVFIKDPDCKEAFLGLEKLIFRVVHNADSKESSGFLGYTYKVDGTDLIVTLDCNVPLIANVGNESRGPVADNEVKKLINAF